MIGKSIANAMSAINKIEARTGRSQMLTTPTSVKPKPPARALKYSCALAKINAAITNLSSAPILIKASEYAKN